MKNTTKKANYHNTGVTPLNSIATIDRTAKGLHLNTEIGVLSTLIMDAQYVPRYIDDSSRPTLIIQLMEHEKALWL